ncbi:bacteriocin-type signal sequence-containing protein [Chryseobacterium oleae]|uniref:Bacteriocin-type signal sequence-containing protein n=1 Tax=Chryseobacterium oleae TaxID=491207 RepID=A0A1I5B086_CHROL|nr:bacteriocin [Chryseobacterium oleae]SFN68146.1 bacteriocin-type signal sequence-containing protein [Chryseobacterium oleae]
MKTSNLQKRKLTKKELKTINGGSSDCYEGFCRMSPNDEWQLGRGDRFGACCF